jgi:hypothetical protein
VGGTTIPEGVLTDVAEGVGALGEGRSGKSPKMARPKTKREIHITARRNRKRIIIKGERMLIIIGLSFQCFLFLRSRELVLVLINYCC